MYMTDRELALLHLWFTNIPEVGIKTRRLLRTKLGTVESIYNASGDMLSEIIGNERIVSNIVNSPDIEHYEGYLRRLEKKNIRIIYPEHPSYPDKLTHIYEPPDILYVRGILWDEHHIHNNNIENNEVKNKGINYSSTENKSIGIVGSRNPDIYGSELAFKFAGELAKNGITVVSGLARGIDSQAHRGAIEKGGYTIAVLGCGINITYPLENAGLYHDIEENGAIVSEYGLDISPNAGYFPLRNRIISGLSDGVLVVCAQKKSGSLITADCALEQGRQVYAIPGRLYDEKSAGTNNLIKQGAMCVTTPDDILNDMYIGEGNVVSLDNEETVVKNVLAPMEKKVYSCLGLEPMYIDDIIQCCNIGITNAISTLYGLEEKGMIKQPIRGYYIVAL